MAYTYTVQKGDTLNSIANRFGFANYKDAGVSSVPSGNFDLIREGESVTLGNYDPNKIKTFTNTPPVISSTDNKAQYLQNSSKLDGITNAFDTSILGKDTKVETKTETKTPTDTSTSTTGDPLFDQMDKLNKEASVKAEAEKAQKKADYEALYQTSLANLDATAKSTIDRINSSYDKRVREQERINRLNIDRTKAYGLANGGQYAPIDFGDAITTREQEASDKINALESERTDLIAQAKMARDNGASKLLQEKLNNLEKVDNDIRKQLNEVEQESEKRYKLLREIRQEEEKKSKERREQALKQITSLAGSFTDEYQDMSPEEKSQFINQLVNKTGLDFGSIYSSIEGAMIANKKNALDIAGKKQDVSKKTADAITAWKKANGVNTGGNTSTKKATPEEMSKNAPTSFTSADDFSQKQDEFIRKYGTAGSSLWDKLYKKDTRTGEYSYTINKGTKSTQKSDEMRTKYNY